MSEVPLWLTQQWRTQVTEGAGARQTSLARDLAQAREAQEQQTQQHLHQLQQLQQQQDQQQQQQQQQQQERATRAAAGEAGLVARVSALREEMLAERARLDMSLQVRAYRKKL